MWKKAALIAAALVLALPAFADNPSNLTRKRQTQVPKTGAPISAKKPQAPRAGAKANRALTENEFVFGKTTQTNVAGGKGSSYNDVSVPGTKKATKPKRRPRALQLNDVTPAVPPPKSQ